MLAQGRHGMPWPSDRVARLHTDGACGGRARTCARASGRAVKANHGAHTALFRMQVPGTKNLCEWLADVAVATSQLTQRALFEHAEQHAAVMSVAPDTLMFMNCCCLGQRQTPLCWAQAEGQVPAAPASAPAARAAARARSPTTVVAMLAGL